MPVAADKSRWKTKKPPRKTLLYVPIFTLLTIFLILLVFNQEISALISPISRKTLIPKCGKTLTVGDRFLWYAPHSGFSNQVSELRNAIIMAAILNRTLIVPPVLDHHAVALGSCPKFRVLDPKELRFRVWDHAVQLIREGRYISMADIVDLSSVSSVVQIVDFKHFVSLWCGADLSSLCSDDSTVQSSVVNSLRQCGSVLSGFFNNVDSCVHAVNLDCRNTVWTYQQNELDDTLDSFQPDEQLQKKKKISYVRLRRDVYKALGPGSEAHLFRVLAFGSLFTSPYRGSELYIDIHESSRDHRIQSLLQKIEYMPFTPDIINAGKEFTQKVVKAPFLCAQLRLLDGQFKNHWKSTFSALKQKLESLKHKGSFPIHIFVMTDLPRSNWSETYLGELASDARSFELHVLSGEDVFVQKTAEKIASNVRVKEKKGHCPQILPDLLLYVEEVVCSCASQGFVGTAGSTIAESIELMRKNGVCLKQN